MGLRDKFHVNFYEAGLRESSKKIYIFIISLTNSINISNL